MDFESPRSGGSLFCCEAGRMACWSDKSGTTCGSLPYSLTESQALQVRSGVNALSGHIRTVGYVYILASYHPN